MTRPDQYVDFDAIIREARMERSMAIANAIANAIAAVSRRFDRVIAKLAKSTSGLHGAKHAEQPRA